MRIEQEVKLDFKDVLIRPKRSTMDTRKQVSLDREFQTLHSGLVVKGVPVIASNIDTIGTFAMAKSLAEFGMFTALHKHYAVDDVARFMVNNIDLWDRVFYTLGMTQKDSEKLEAVQNRMVDIALHEDVKIFQEDDFLDNMRKMSSGFPRLLCLDVANGYIKQFHEFVKTIRDAAPHAIIMAGNVATPEMVQQLLECGADIVKIGTGNGCFVPGTKVKLKDGCKNIEDIEVGDEVLTHRGEYKKVIATTSREENKEVYSINDIQCTGNHEFYVLHKKYRNIVNDENMDEFAEWISAENLTKDYVLLKIKKD